MTVHTAAGPSGSRSHVARGVLVAGLSLTLLAPIPASAAQTETPEPEVTASPGADATQPPEQDTSEPQDTPEDKGAETDAPETAAPETDETGEDDDAADSGGEADGGQAGEETTESPKPDDDAETAEQDAAETEEETGTDDVVDLQVLSINDFHGRLEPGDGAGASAIACTVDYYREQNPNTLFVGAGDHIGASTFTSFIQQDNPSIDALNAMGLDVTSLGNHEFDQGQDDFNDRVIPRSDFQWLGANARDAATGEPLYDPYWTTDIDGVTIGFIGLVTENMPNLVNPEGIEGIEWTSMSAEANHYAEVLVEQEDADVVVVMVHEGLPTPDLASAEGLPFGDLVNEAHPSIDAIISGHTHLPYAHDVDGMWVTQAGEYGNYLGLWTLSVDAETGELLESEAELIDMAESICDSHPEVDALVADAVEIADELGLEVVAEVPGEVPFQRATNDDGTENRGASSTVGQLVADAQVWAVRQNQHEADFAVTNAGGLRADLPLGELTYRDLADVQPFANTLVNVELTGEQVYQLFEEQWREDGSFNKHGQSAEVRYFYDVDADQGERVTDVFIDGEPVIDDQIYMVAMNSYMAAGGGIEVSTEAVSQTDLGLNDLEAFVSYGRQVQTLDPQLDRRAVGVSWDDDAVYAPGDQISLALSSLAFSSESIPVGDTVEVSLSGFDVGEFDLDLEYVYGTDERGQVEIVVEVPAALELAGVAPGIGSFSAAVNGAGEAQAPLVIREPVTGTEVVLPVTLAAGAVEEPTEEPTAEPTEPTSSQEPTADVTEDTTPGPTTDPSPEPTPVAIESPEAGPAAETDVKGGVLAQTGAAGVITIALLALLLLTLGGYLLHHRTRSRPSS